MESKLAGVRDDIMARSAADIKSTTDKCQVAESQNQAMLDQMQRRLGSDCAGEAIQPERILSDFIGQMNQRQQQSIELQKRLYLLEQEKEYANAMQ